MLVNQRKLTPIEYDNSELITYRVHTFHVGKSPGLWQIRSMETTPWSIDWNLAGPEVLRCSLNPVRYL